MGNRTLPSNKGGGERPRRAPLQITRRSQPEKGSKRMGFDDQLTTNLPETAGNARNAAEMSLAKTHTPQGFLEHCAKSWNPTECPEPIRM